MDSDTLRNLRDYHRSGVDNGVAKLVQNWSGNKFSLKVRYGGLKE